MHYAVKTLAAIAVVIAAPSAAPPSMAQTQSPSSRSDTVASLQVTANSVRVPYRDLNLETEAGRSVIRARIHRASYYVCGVDLQPLQQQLHSLACVNVAKRDAFDQLAAARSRVYAQADQVLVMPMSR